MYVLTFAIQFLSGISLIGLMVWIFLYFETEVPYLRCVLLAFALGLSIAFSPCISAVFIVLGAILQFLWNFVVSPFGYGVINSWPFISLVLQILLPLLPLVFIAIWLKNRYFPTFSFQSLFQREDQSQNSSNSSYTSPLSDLEQLGAEEIPSNNSMPVFLRKRAQRLGLTQSPSSIPNATNPQPAQPTVSSQPVPPAEPIDPTLLPHSEDVPGQTVYRRIIPIKP
jgi:signal transduction histidine kinase